MTKYVLQQFEEQNGDFTYRHHYVFSKKDFDAMDEIQLINKFFGCGVSKEDVDQYSGDDWANQYWDGARLLSCGATTDITAADYAVLEKLNLA